MRFSTYFATFGETVTLRLVRRMFRALSARVATSRFHESGKFLQFEGEFIHPSQRAMNLFGKKKQAPPADPSQTIMNLRSHLETLDKRSVNCFPEISPIAMTSRSPIDGLSKLLAPFLGSMCVCYILTLLTVFVLQRGAHPTQSRCRAPRSETKDEPQGQKG